jgi:hypothetical protein
MALNERRYRASDGLALEPGIGARPSARGPASRRRTADQCLGHAVGFTLVGVIGRPNGQLGLYSVLSEQALDGAVAGCALELEDAGRRGAPRLVEGGIQEPGFRAVLFRLGRSLASLRLGARAKTAGIDSGGGVTHLLGRFCTDG